MVSDRGALGASTNSSNVYGAKNGPKIAKDRIPRTIAPPILA